MALAKIYKSNLQGLLEEISRPGPVYITSTQRTEPGNGGLVIITFAVEIAGWNTNDRVVELYVEQPAVLAMADRDVDGAAGRNRRNYDDLKYRLVQLDYEVRDGAISDKPVRGGIE